LNAFDPSLGKENFRKVNKGSEIEDQDMSDSDGEDYGIAGR
jgi:hypothetical protein